MKYILLTSVPFYVAVKFHTTESLVGGSAENGFLHKISA
jgi:hypothetical protein